MTDTLPPATLVTGGNRGLGLELCRQLAAQGKPVLLAARTAEVGGQAAEPLQGVGATVMPVVVDVADMESIRALSAQLRAKGQLLAGLVNNAAVALEGLDSESAVQTLTVNVLGPLLMADTLGPLLLPGAPVVMMSSGMGALSGLGASLQSELRAEDLTREAVLGLAERYLAAVGAARAAEEGWPASAYSTSKALLNGLVRALAREPQFASFRLNAVCPGWVRTRMGGSGAARSVEEGASGLAWAATLPPDGPTGGFFRDGQAIDW